MWEKKGWGEGAVCKGGRGGGMESFKNHSCCSTCSTKVDILTVWNTSIVISIRLTKLLTVYNHFKEKVVELKKIQQIKVCFVIPYFSRESILEWSTFYWAWQKFVFIECQQTLKNFYLTNYFWWNASKLTGLMVNPSLKHSHAFDSN